MNKIIESGKNIEKLIESAEIRKAYNEFLSLSSEGNKYFNDTQPWKIINENKQRTNNILYVILKLLKALAIFSAPYLPETSILVWKQLNLPGNPTEPGMWTKVMGDFSDEHIIGKPKFLFFKINFVDIKKYKKITSKITPVEELFK